MPAQPPASARAARLAQALRENLRRRKAQAQARGAPDATGQPGAAAARTATPAPDAPDASLKQDAPEA